MMDDPDKQMQRFAATSLKGSGGAPAGGDDSAAQAVAGPRPEGAAWPMKSAKARLTWIDAAKGLSMVLVVLLHSAAWYVDGQRFGDSIWLDFSRAVEPLRIPLFFVVSGTLIARRIEGDRPKVLRRAASLFSVYVLWSVIHASRLVLFPALAPQTPFSPELIFWTIISPGIYWYIWALPIYYVVTVLVYGRRISEHRASAGVYATFVLAALCSFFWAEISALWSDGLALDSRVEYDFSGSAVRNYFWFLLGVMVSKTIIAQSKLIPCSGVRPLAIGIGLIVAGMLVARIGVHAKFSLAPFLMVPGAIILLCRIGESFVATVLVKIGAQTLPVYIFHFFILNALSFLVGKFVAPGLLPVWLSVTIPPLMTLVIVPSTMAAENVLRRLRLDIVLDGIPDGLSKYRRSANVSQAA